MYLLFFFPLSAHISPVVKTEQTVTFAAVLLRSFEEQAVFVTVQPSLTSWRAALTTTDQRQQPCNHLPQ